MVTLICPIEGLGDNGYYDDIAASLFEFVETTGAQFRMLYPDSLADARQMYADWLAANDTVPNSLLVLTVQSHADFVRQLPPSLKGKGSGIIVIDPDSAALPATGVSPIYIDRYSACYLAGAMCHEFSTLSLLAAPSLQCVKESAQGFADGHAAYAADTLTRTVEVLSPDEEGFDLPDYAFRYVSERSDQTGLMIFPMIGGSAVGAYRALEGNLSSTTLAVGMEGDKSGYCSRVPFSVVYHVGSNLLSMLRTWNSTGQLPTRAELTLDNGGTSIVFNDNFLNLKTYSSSLWSFYWFAADGYFKALYERYRHQLPASLYMNH